MNRVVEVDGGSTIWRFDADFLESRWTCIWGRGCLGIEDEPAPELGRGCCSVGAELGDVHESRMIAALAATLKPERFQFHDEAQGGGIFRDEERNATRVIDRACIFLNRPGFEGGAGCALHLAAIDADESPMDWKPSVCWQLPIRVEWERRDERTEVATVRRWSRADWGEEGETMAWCCTEGDLAYVGEQRVIDSLGPEIEEIVSRPVYVTLRARLEE